MAAECGFDGVCGDAGGRLLEADEDEEDERLDGEGDSEEAAEEAVEEEED